MRGERLGHPVPITHQRENIGSREELGQRFEHALPTAHPDQPMMDERGPGK
jgi:hypothetical protein